jgi:hypothetical protein
LQYGGDMAFQETEGPPCDNRRQQAACYRQYRVKALSQDSVDHAYGVDATNLVAVEAARFG